MTDDARVRELLAPLREHNAASDTVDVCVDRERVLEHMSRTASKRTFVTLAARWQGVAWAFAAAVAFALGFAGYRAAQSQEQRAKSPPPSLSGAISGTDIAVEARSAPSENAAGANLPVRGEFDSTRSVHTSFGAIIYWSKDTQVGGLQALEATGKLVLNDGVVRCEVLKLLGGREFQVLTPTAQIVGVGSVFEVSVRTLGGHSETRVAVEEGVVTVHQGTETTLVRATQAWSGVSALVEPELPLQPPARAAESSTTGAKGTPRASQDADRSGTLAQETRLFQAALRVERSGDRVAAHQLFQELLQKYPASPLAPYARQGLSRTAR